MGRPKTAKHRACGAGKILSKDETQSVRRLKSGQVVYFPSVGEKYEIEGYTPLSQKLYANPVKDKFLLYNRITEQYCIDENDLFYHLNCPSIKTGGSISLIPELKNPAPKIAKFLDFYGCLTSMFKNNMHSEDSCF